MNAANLSGVIVLREFMALAGDVLLVVLVKLATQSENWLTCTYTVSVSCSVISLITAGCQRPLFLCSLHSRLHCGPGNELRAIRYDTTRDAIFNLRSKADISQLNVPHGNKEYQ